MGALLDTPKTDKYNEIGDGNGLRYAIASMQGWRISMEDSHCAITQLPGNLKDWSFFAIFDGHTGASVSELCAKELLKCLIDTDEFKKIEPYSTLNLPEIKRGIRDGFLSFDARLRQLPHLASGKDKSGSTAICVLISPEHIIFANCGDSRAIFIRDGTVTFSTIDHKPINPDENQRIQNAGGSVIVQRVNGSLAVSRSLGDYAYKSIKGLGPTEQLISPEPEITILDRNKEQDEIIVLACDGIWDVLNNETLCYLLRNRMRCTEDLSVVCNMIIDVSLYKGSSDNMSIALIALDHALHVDPNDKDTDEQLDSVIIKRMKELFDSRNAVISVDSALEYLQSFSDPQFPSNSWLCKVGKIQDLIENHCALRSLKKL